MKTKLERAAEEYAKDHAPAHHPLAERVRRYYCEDFIAGWKACRIEAEKLVTRNAAGNHLRRYLLNLGDDPAEE